MHRPLARAFEAVSESPHRLQQTRVGRVILDLHAEAAHVRVDEPAVTQIVVSPNVHQQLLTRKQLTLALDEFTQQAKLGLREVDDFAGSAQRACFGPDLDVLEAEDLAYRVR